MASVPSISWNEAPERDGGRRASSSTSTWQWARSRVGGAKDLLLDVVDTILGIEYEDDDFLPTCTAECDSDNIDAGAISDSGSSDGGSPHHRPRSSPPPAAPGVVGGLMSALSLNAFKSFSSSSRQKSDDYGDFDLLPRTSQQAHRMTQSRSQRGFVDLAAFTGEWQDLMGKGCSGSNAL